MHSYVRFAKERLAPRKRHVGYDIVSWRKVGLFKETQSIDVEHAASFNLHRSLVIDSAIEMLERRDFQLIAF